VGLATNKDPSPLRLKYKTLNQCSFCQFLECHTPLRKRKAPLLKIIWRRFWWYSQAYVGFDRVNHIKLTFITPESHHVCETLMFDPLLFPWSCSGSPTFLNLESPLLRSRSHTHENHELRSWSHVHEKKSSGPEAVSFLRRLRSPAVEASKLETSCSRVIATNISVMVKGGWGCFGTSVLRGETSIAAVPAMSWQLIAKSAVQTLTAFHFSIFYTRFHHFPRLI